MKAFKSSTYTQSLTTNYYFVTVKDGQYITTEKPSYSLNYRNKFGEWVYWSKSTFTQCIVTVYGDDMAANFIDDDISFKDNIAALICIADDWEIIDAPMTIKLVKEDSNDS